VEAVVVRILFNMGHPADIHLFKHAIRLLERGGHECGITCIRKDVLQNLLDAGGYSYTPIGNFSSTLFGKMLEQIRIELRLYLKVRDFAPDLLVGGTGGVAVAQVGVLARIPSLVFDDTEHAKIEHALLDPFASTICTPSCYQGNLGSKQVRYDGNHALAYLHPNYFTPNPAVLAETGLTQDDPYIIVRFVSWDASHDVGQQGISDKIGLVKALEPYGRILITSEGPLPQELESYRIQVSPEKMHDLLYYALLYIGEGATMASESAVLGTHAIYVSTLRLGYIDEEKEKYDLVSTFSDPEEIETRVLDTAVRLLNDPLLRRRGKESREKLIREKIDVTAFMTWLIEEYPDSIHRLEHDPGIQDRFRSNNGG
jgi:predicted glycosyltransferase